MGIDLERLRETGFLEHSDIVLDVKEGDWTGGSDNYVCPVDIKTTNSKKRVWLKAYVGSFGNGIITGTNTRINIARLLADAGANIPKTELYEPGTIVQEHIEGISYDKAERYLSGRDFRKAGENVQKQLSIYEKCDLKYPDHMGNFIITPDCKAYLVDLWLLKK